MKMLAKGEYYEYSLFGIRVLHDVAGPFDALRIFGIKLPHWLDRVWADVVWYLASHFGKGIEESRYCI